MKDLIIATSIQAVVAVTHPRFFLTKRGYQGRYYCALMREFDERRLLDDGDRIIEMEYQKHAMHGFYQRPARDLGANPILCPGWTFVVNSGGGPLPRYVLGTVGPHVAIVPGLYKGWLERGADAHAVVGCFLRHAT